MLFPDLHTCHGKCDTRTEIVKRIKKQKETRQGLSSLIMLKGLSQDMFGLVRQVTIEILHLVSCRFREPGVGGEVRDGSGVQVVLRR